MEEVEKLRKELAEEHVATKKALALLAHSLANQHDAAQLLRSLMANYRAALIESSSSDPFDELVSAMLWSVSSIALKQRPNDRELQDLYRNLRSGPRN